MAEANAMLGFSVSELTLSILDGFLAAAELHLGEASPSAPRLASPDPMQAWLALKSAGALMDQLATVMSEDVRVPLYARLTYLFERFEEHLPPGSSDNRTSPVASLEGVVEEALKSMHEPDEAKPMAPEAPAAPAVPGTGLPRRGSGLLFPPRGR